MALYLFKIVVSGEGSVGKSTFIQRIITGKFQPNITMTIGVDFYTYKINYGDNDLVFQLWDLGGQDRFQFMHSYYTKGAKAGIIIYDITRYGSIEKLNQWFTLIRSENPSLPIILLGAKADLADPKLVEGFLIDPYFAQFNPVAHIPISSKTGMGITESIQALAHHLMNITPNTPLINVKAN